MVNEFIKRILTSAALLPILIYITIYSGIYLLILLTIFYMLSLYEITKNTKNILFILFASIFLFFSFYSFYFLRGDSDYSLTILFWILMSTFLSDVGGYIFGKTFKGKKLTKISPNKTYAGAFGSFILSMSSLFFMNLLQLAFLNKLLINFTTTKFIILTILISAVCQLGDLFVSFLKRKIKIKNISNFLPGHGGILDRIDGLIFVLIFSFTLNQLKLI